MSDGELKKRLVQTKHERRLGNIEMCCLCGGYFGLSELKDISDFFSCHCTICEKSRPFYACIKCYEKKVVK